MSRGLMAGINGPQEWGLEITLWLKWSQPSDIRMRMEETQLIMY